MEGSNQQNQIDALQKELDDQRQENIRLKAKLRVADAIGNLGGGLLDEMGRLALETEQYKADAERIAAAVVNAYMAAQNALKKATQEAQEWNDTLEGMIEKDPVPQIVIAMQEIIQKLLTAEVEGYTDGLNQIVERTGKSYENAWNAYTEPGVMMAALLYFHKLTATLQVKTIAAKGGLAYSKNPNMVADDVINECIAKGKPDIKTVSRLPLDWIARNLPDAPAKYDTLQNGLEAVRAFKNSGLNRRSYCRSNPVTESALREYEKWYEALEKLSLSPKSLIG